MDTRVLSLAPFFFGDYPIPFDTFLGQCSFSDSRDDFLVSGSGAYVTSPFCKPPSLFLYVKMNRILKDRTRRPFYTRRCWWSLNIRFRAVRRIRKHYNVLAPI